MRCRITASDDKNGHDGAAPAPIIIAMGRNGYCAELFCREGHTSNYSNYATHII